MPAIITVENLSKAYRIGHKEKVPDTLVGAMKSWAGDPLLNLRNLRRLDTFSEENYADDIVWALRDVSFEIEQGEVLGIIGRNGAGKSTLLKILSNITEPTRGRAVIRGRVSSLLEVGTGFHPEMTGRDNVYLNGTILGMTKREIDRKFDEIVDFSGVERFLDTPIKRYSSGMQVRLAFAVAAHLDPEILIVDEVLAVGDVEFQKKCLGKMQDVSRGGRTVLFVSHDMSNVTKLCDSGILLTEGEVESQGEMTSVVANYLKDNVAGEGYADLSQRGDRSGSGDARFQSVELLSWSMRCATFPFGGPFTIRLCIVVKQPIGNAQVAATILTNDGIPVHCLWNLSEGMTWPTDAGKYLFEINVPKLQLLPGGYVLNLWIGDYQASRVDYLRGAVGFQVFQTPESGVGSSLNRRDGLVFARSGWNCRKL